MVALSVTPCPTGEHLDGEYWYTVKWAPAWQSLAAIQALSSNAQARASIGSRLTPLSAPLIPEGLPHLRVPTLTKAIHSAIKPDLDVTRLPRLPDTKVPHFIH
eukprot:scaffold195392_cov18-Prasinocladus_malaysianus.AAC.1